MEAPPPAGARAAPRNLQPQCTRQLLSARTLPDADASRTESRLALTDAAAVQDLWMRHEISPGGLWRSAGDVDVDVDVALGSGVARSLGHPRQ